MTEETTDMVPARFDGQMAAYDPTAEKDRYWTSLDLTTDSGAAAFMRAVQSELPLMTQQLGTAMPVRDVLVHPAAKTDPETGEVIGWPRSVVILADGSMLSAGSRGIYQSIAMLCRVVGAPPWVPALSLVVRSKKLAVGHWYWLEMLAQEGKVGKRAK